MSELLRAVLDKSCIYSNPAFYTAEIAYVAASDAPQTTYVEIKADKYFLITSISFTNFSTAGGGTSAPAFGKYQIRRSRSSQSLFPFPLNPSYFGSASDREVFTLPHYILCDPTDLLEITFQPDLIAANRIFSLTFNGIEYGK